jgi:hypothetical protein
MLPYSAGAAIDYTAAYQSRPGAGGVGLSSSNGGASFTHSWLVPSQDFKPNQQEAIEPGHVCN